MRAAATLPRVVTKPVARLVGDRRHRAAQAQLAVEAAALHDALRQHAVKHRSRVEAHVDVAQEIRDVLRRRVVLELEHGAAAVRADGDLGRV